MRLKEETRERIGIKAKALAFRKGLCFCREDRIRTCDPLVQNQVFYRAELPPEQCWGANVWESAILNNYRGNRFL
jgi:hypothetical protein